MKPFAVVVLNWNGVELLKKFMPLWVQYAETELSDLIIVDNGSTDESCSFLKKNYPNIQLIKFLENNGYAGGYNEALKLLKYQYVVLLNSDATPKSSDWLDEAYDLFTNDDTIVAVQPKIKDFNKPNYFEYAGGAGGYLDCFGYPYCRGRVFHSIEEDRGQYQELKPILWASGAALIIRREVFLSVGGFDEHFFAHQEEIDLCFRLRTRGFKIVYAPNSEVFHIGGASLDNESPRKLYLNYRNNLLMLYKNLNTAYLLFVLFIRFILDFGVALFFLIKGEWAKTKVIFRAYYDFFKLIPSFYASRKKNLLAQRLRPSKLLTPNFFIFILIAKNNR